MCVCSAKAIWQSKRNNTTKPPVNGASIYSLLQHTHQAILTVPIKNDEVPSFQDAVVYYYNTMYMVYYYGGTYMYTYTSKVYHCNCTTVQSTHTHNLIVVYVVCVAFFS